MPGSAWVTTGLLVGFALSTASCDTKPGLSPEQKAEIEQIMAEAKARAEPLDAARKAAIQAAHGTLVPRPDLGPCDVRPRPLEASDRGAFADQDRTYQLSMTPISAVRAEDLAESTGPRAYRVRVGLVDKGSGMLISAYRPESPEAHARDVAKLKELLDPPWLKVDGTLVIDSYTAAKAEGPTFTPGAIRGRFYMYEYATGTIRCAADVTASSYDDMASILRKDASGALVVAASDLERDLMKQGIAAAIQVVSLAGPPLPDGTVTPDPSGLRGSADGGG